MSDTLSHVRNNYNRTSVIFLEKFMIFPVFPADEIRSQKKQQDDVYFTEAAAMRSAAFFTISLAESVVRTEKRRYLSPYFIT